jgi:hypothetical protein
MTNKHKKLIVLYRKLIKWAKVKHPNLITTTHKETAKGNEYERTYKQLPMRWQDGTIRRLQTLEAKAVTYCI